MPSDSLQPEEQRPDTRPTEAPPIDSEFAPAGEPSLAAVPDTPLQSLDRRVIVYWRIQSLVGSAILLGLAFIAGLMALFNHPEWWPFLAAIFAGLAVLRLALAVWYPPRSYRAWGYRLDDRVLETRRGVWFHVITLLPLSRLQHVDLHRGPLERYYGLASLHLQTAGTHNDTILLPGLDADEAVRLRDRLVAAGGDDAV